MKTKKIKNNWKSRTWNGLQFAVLCGFTGLTVLGCSKPISGVQETCTQKKDGLSYEMKVIAASEDAPVDRVEMKFTGSLKELGIPEEIELSSKQLQALMSAYLGHIGSSDSGMKAEVKDGIITVQFTLDADNLEEFNLGEKGTIFKDAISNAQSAGAVCS